MREGEEGKEDRGEGGGEREGVKERERATSQYTNTAPPPRPSSASFQSASSVL